MRVSGRIETVECLRGLAALAVTWFHLTNTHSGGWGMASGSRGWLGVEVFFVISGFVIPYSIARSHAAYAIADFPRFLLRRAARLEPPYLASIVLVLGLGYLSALAPGFRGLPPSLDPAQIAAHLLYLVPVTGEAWLQPVYWTLAYEFVFYVLVGLLFPWIGTPADWGRWTAVALVVTASVMAGILPVRSLLFVLGFSLFRIIAGGGQRSAAWGWSIIALAGLVIAWTEPMIALVGLATTALINLLLTSTWPGRWGKTLLWLGGLSYSLYLTHVPVGGRVVNLGHRFIAGPWQELALSLLALLVCLAFAALFRRLFELPAIAWSRRVRGAPVARLA
jgi:peptidoglycan/LPS O-acetylase OafA/YrhL